MVEVDLKNFFDTVPLYDMMKILENYFTDEAVLHLIKKFLFCRISTDGSIENKLVGLVQGNAISPVLSNLYLNQFDMVLESGRSSR